MQHNLRSLVRRRAIPWIRKFLFYGSQFMCPVCKCSVRRMRPGGLRLQVLEDLNVIGGGWRENFSCPVCECTDRERLVWLYLSSSSNIRSMTGAILHVAPEYNLSRLLSEMDGVTYVSADIFRSDVMERMDIRSIGYPNSHFDLVVCNHVLEHVLDDFKAIIEIYRVLKPGGFAVLQVPIARGLTETLEDPAIIDPAERERVFGQNDHVRLYATDYVNRLEYAGFDVEQFKWWEAGPDFGGKENIFGLNVEEVLYLAKKQH